LEEKKDEDGEKSSDKRPTAPPMINFRTSLEAGFGFLFALFRGVESVPWLFSEGIREERGTVSSKSDGGGGLVFATGLVGLISVKE